MLPVFVKRCDVFSHHRVDCIRGDKQAVVNSDWRSGYFDYSRANVVLRDALHFHFVGCNDWILAYKTDCCVT